VAVFSTTSYILAYREFLLIVDSQGTDRSPFITDEAARGKIRWLLPDKNAIDRFYGAQFTRTVVEGAGSEPLVFEVGQVTAVAKAQERLLVVEPTAVRLVGSLPQTEELVRLWQMGGEEKLFELFATLSKEVPSETAFSVFSELWKGGEIAGALSLAGRQAIVGQVGSIIGLMPLVSTGTRAPELPLPKRDIKPTDQLTIAAVTDFLKGTRDQILADPLSKRRQELQAVNVAYAESLAMKTQNPPCRELDQVILDGNIDLDVLVKLLKAHEALPLGPAVAVDWLLAHDQTKPQQALIPIISPHHDDAMVIRWLEENGLAAHRLRYYCYLLIHKIGGAARGSRTGRCWTCSR
jgi:hypothetical protein